MIETRKLILYLFVIFWLAPALVLAQADCPEIIRAALDATDEACDTTERNQACYGNISLQAEPQDGVANFNFSTPGDIVDVAGVQTLTLLPWDEAEIVWGIALMRLQTGLPDTLPGQNVTFLLFGDVQIENAVTSNTDPVTFIVVARQNIDVRSTPSTENVPVSQLSVGDEATAMGRSDDLLWLQIELADNTTGWVAVDDIKTEGDISLLNVIDPSSALTETLTPMQAFYFRSGIGDAPCAEAPDSGILVQTPEGSGHINFTVNEVDISLGSTAYLQAQPGGDMTISVVEGGARITAAGVTVYAPTGTRVRIPLDANGIASGAPVGPEPYGNLDVLPVDILDRVVAIAKPLTAAEIETLLSTLTPVSGTWQALRDSCSPDFAGRIINLSIQRDGQDLTFGEARYVQIDTGVYRYDYDGGWWIMHVIAPDYLEFEDNSGCISVSELIEAEA